MEEKKRNPISKFDIIFFTISFVLIIIIGLRFHELTLSNAVPTFLLVASAPFIYKYLEKNHGEEKKVQSKLDIIDTMTETELAKRIASIYNSRGFAIQYYDSVQPGVHMICQRKGVRNGETFIERGLILVIHTTEPIEYSDFLSFSSDIRSMNATQGMMVTNSRFSPEILDEANKYKIALWGRKELRDKFRL